MNPFLARAMMRDHRTAVLDHARRNMLSTQWQRWERLLGEWRLREPVRELRAALAERRAQVQAERRAGRDEENER